VEIAKINIYAPSLIMPFTAPVFTKRSQFLWTFRMPNFV